MTFEQAEKEYDNLGDEDKFDWRRAWSGEWDKSDEEEKDDGDGEY